MLRVEIALHELLMGCEMFRVNSLVGQRDKPRILAIVICIAIPPAASIWHSKSTRARAHDAHATSNIGSEKASVALFAPLDSSMVEVSVATGDAVKKGQLLFKTEAQELENRLVLTTSYLNKTEVYARAGVRLGDTGPDVWLARADVLRQQKEALARMIESMSVRSPIDGFVAGIRKELPAGESVPAGTLMAIVTTEPPSEQEFPKGMHMLDVN